MQLSGVQPTWSLHPRLVTVVEAATVGHVPLQAGQQRQFSFLFWPVMSEFPINRMVTAHIWDVSSLLSAPSHTTILSGPLSQTHPETRHLKLSSQPDWIMLSIRWHLNNSGSRILDILHSFRSHLPFYSLYDMCLVFFFERHIPSFFFSCSFWCCCEVVTFIFISFLGLAKLQRKIIQFYVLI